MHAQTSELLEKLNRIAAKPGFPQLSLIERDLFLHYLRELYALMDNPMSATPDAAQHAIPLVTNTKKNDSPVPPNSLGMDDKEPIIEEHKTSDEEQTDFLSVIAKESQQDAPFVEEKKEREGLLYGNATAKVSLNEKVQRTENLNDKLGGKQPDVYKKMSARPFRELVDFNKRFAFVHELFGGDTEAFSRAVEVIDQSATWQEAQTFIQQTLVITYHWEQSAPNVHLFSELVKQRFGTD